MALLNPINFSGLSIDDGYWKITQFYWNDKEPNKITIRLNGFANQSTYQEDEGAIKGEEIEIKISSESIDEVETEINTLFGVYNREELKTLCFLLIKTLAYLEAKQTELFLSSQDA